MTNQGAGMDGGDRRARSWRISVKKDATMEQMQGLRAYPQNEEGIPLEWIQMCEAGLIPDGVPHRPDLASAEWRGWEEFFGDVRTDVDSFGSEMAEVFCNVIENGEVIVAHINAAHEASFEKVVSFTVSGMTLQLETESFAKKAGRAGDEEGFGSSHSEAGHLGECMENETGHEGGDNGRQSD